MKKLDAFFKRNMVIHTAYMKKLSEWSFVKYDDRPALKSVYIFLSKCNCAMKTTSHLAILNHATKHAGSSSEAPLGSTKWRENVVKIRCKDGEVAGFAELVEFLEDVAESGNDPVYGKEALNKAKQWTNGPPQNNKGSPPFKPKVNSFIAGLDTIP